MYILYVEPSVYIVRRTQCIYLELCVCVTKVAFLPEMLRVLLRCVASGCVPVRIGSPFLLLQQQAFDKRGALAVLTH